MYPFRAGSNRSPRLLSFLIMAGTTRVSVIKVCRPALCHATATSNSDWIVDDHGRDTTRVIPPVQTRTSAY